MPCRKEAMSIASVEARAMGLPVLARRPNGVSDVIEHGVHGFLAASDEEFVGCLAQLLSDAGLRQRMSEETRRGLDRFSWDHSIRRHIELYELARERMHGAGSGSSGAEQSRYPSRSETLSATQTTTP
jgi:glycosyltransferase involved in cell wall biosynthesis